MERKIHIYYTSGEGRSTERVIWPLIILFYLETPMLVAWCELRQTLRHFRFDRLRCAKTLADQFEGQGVRLRCIWTAQGQDQMI
ncbi:MAG: helix-turn-helix transcriptional regulator [Paracoccaceae bacterium]